MFCNFFTPIFEEALSLRRVERREFRHEAPKLARVRAVTLSLTLSKVEHFVERYGGQVDAYCLDIELDHMSSGRHVRKFENVAQRSGYVESISEWFELEVSLAGNRPKKLRPERQDEIAGDGCTGTETPSWDFCARCRFSSSR